MPVNIHLSNPERNLPENIGCITHRLLTEFSTPYVDKIIIADLAVRFRYYIMWIICEPITSIMLNDLFPYYLSAYYVYTYIYICHYVMGLYYPEASSKSERVNNFLDNL